MNLPGYSSVMSSVLMMTFLLTSCSALDVLLPTVTPSAPTGTPPPSATIVWFPPSATPSPQTLATQSPTPEMHPGLGPTILTEDFSNSGNWDTAADANGSVAIDRNRLTLAAQPGVYLVSFHHGLVIDDQA